MNMDYSPWSEMENLAVFEGSSISETGEVTHTKIDVHACPCPEREIWPFLKGSHISETRVATPTKIGMHNCDINPYLDIFFELIPID